MSVPRRSIDEIAVRYKLEPGLDDIYVEGSSDKKIIDKAFRSKSIHRPVYEIDSVDIPNEVLKKYDLTSGNKQRVIALCMELALNNNYKVTFLVDRDMDRHLDRQFVLDRLLYTRHCDIESFFLDEEIVREIVCDAGGVNSENWSELYLSVESVVKKLFCVRLSLDQINYNGNFPKLNKSLRKENGKIVIDINDLIKRCDGTSVKLSDILEKFSKWVDEVDACDARDAGRGHDYIEVIGWLIKKFNGSRSVAESIDNIILLLVPRRAENIIALF